MALIPYTFESFGLDIGEKSLKLCYAKKHGPDAELVSFGSMSVTEGIFRANTIHSADVLSTLIQKLKKSVSGKTVRTPYVHACLPEQSTFIKLITVPHMEQSQLETHIREQLPKHIPLQPKDMYVDWRILDYGPDSASVYVLIGAIDKKISDTYTAVLIAAGLKPVSLQIEAEAIARALLPTQALYDAPIGIIDMGATRSSFICYDKGIVQYSLSMPIASMDITALIERTLKLPRAEAESAKHVCGIDPKHCDGSLIDILMPTIDELVTYIKKNAEFYPNRFSHGSPIHTFILTGGGAQLRGLREGLMEKIPDSTFLFGDPLIHFTKNKNARFSAARAQTSLDFLLTKKHMPLRGICPPQNSEISYTTAIGLALTSIVRE